MKVRTGLDRICNEVNLHEKLQGNIGLLCHSASITPDYRHGAIIFQEIFKNRLKKIFGPQHGFVTDVQDNMVETQDYLHPYFKIPVHSLYSHTRKPTPEMLKGINTLVVDLQDVGTRIYTYIYTLTYAMEACADLGIKVVVLDRPNPIGGDLVEGNILDLAFQSFVGRHPLPVRHGLTMGEVALMAKHYWNIPCELEVIPMNGWKRAMGFSETGLPWVLPSPNLPTIEGALTFGATVFFEGTNISEGRGTTRSLEIFGHPKIEPFSWFSHLEQSRKQEQLTGFILRPLVFLPTFQKYQGTPCGGYQIHVTNPKEFRPWRVGQWLMRELYHHLGNDYQWKQPPYEYVYDLLPIDVINGTDQLRRWVEQNGKMSELNFYDSSENPAFKNYLAQFDQIKIYKD